MSTRSSARVAGLLAFGLALGGALGLAACSRGRGSARETFRRTIEVGSVELLGPGCPERLEPHDFFLAGEGRRAVFLPAGCAFRMPVRMSGRGRLSVDLALHEADRVEPGLPRPSVSLGVESDGRWWPLVELGAASFGGGEPRWLHREAEFPAGRAGVVFVVGRVRPRAPGRRHARVGLARLVVEEIRPRPFPVSLSEAPPPSRSFLRAVPPGERGRALWRRWWRNRQVLSRALGDPVDDELRQAALAAARDQERSFEEFRRRHGEARFWRLWREVPGRGDPSGRPDLVLLVLDCARSDHVSSLGAERETTPRLDAALASRGLVFEGAYSTGTATNYSMPAMLTGRTATVHRFQRGLHLRTDLPTLAERLRRAGYLTVAVQSNPFLGPGSGLERGFFLYDPLEHDYVPYPKAARVVARARELAAFLRWLPTFLYVHLMDAHGPYRPVSPDDRRFDGRPYSRRDEVWNLRASPPYLERETFRLPPRERARYVNVERLRTLYDGELRTIDRELGGLLGELDRSGQLAQAAVLLTADHGEEFLEHGLTYHDSIPHEEKVRVPLLLRLPAGDARGAPRRVRRRVDAVLGVAPTLLGLAGVGIPSELDGRDLLGEAAADGPQPPLFFDDDWVRGVRLGRWKLIVASEEARARFAELRLAGLGAETLFDLEADPRETRDRSAARPDVVRRLRALLEVRFAPLEREASRAAARPAPLDAERRQRLRALGYAE